MDNLTPALDKRKPRKLAIVPPPAASLRASLDRQLIGQDNAIEQIIPFVEMHQAGLAPDGRPVGVFLLLGPTGTGKTRTVEALAQAIHGSQKKLLRVDCGEFQMEHEVAKLIGAPPGYLGHRDTDPLLTEQKLKEVTSERSNLSLVLFDEIEKAAASLTRLLLGVLDKASLRLGNNTTVNFERSLIFLTSNLGAREMLSYLKPQFGFSGEAPAEGEVTDKLQAIGLSALKKRFAPEFVNRVDAVVTYQPLSSSTITEILSIQVTALQEHIDRRLGKRSFRIDVQPSARAALIGAGTSAEFGARELNRTIHRKLFQPLAAMVNQDQIPPEATVKVEANDAGALKFRVKPLRIEDGNKAA